jgi:hypothetical protein
MNTISQINSKVNELQSAFKATESRRTFWEDKLKSYIKDGLQYLINSNILVGFELTTNEVQTNLESVILYQPDNPSGIYESRSSTSFTHYVKYGGYLMFAQLQSGLIAAIVQYPYIEKITSQKPHKVLEFYEPEEFKTSQLEECVLKFIEEMISWEKDKEPDFKPIGFSIPQKKKNDI